MNDELMPAIPAPQVTKDLAPLYAKLAEVMGDVQRVAKEGRNEFHKYDYAREAEIVDEVRQALVKHRVAMIATCVWQEKVPEFVDGKPTKNSYTKIALDVTFADGDSGAAITTRWYGEGQDVGDKGLYKAYTGAIKYALLKTFLIPTGDDPEDDSDDQLHKAGEKAQNQARTAASKANALAPKADKPAAPTNPPTNTAATTDAPKCADCGVEVADKTASFSKTHFGRILCYKCQEKERLKGASA